MSPFLRKIILLFSFFTPFFIAFSQIDELNQMVESSDSIGSVDLFEYNNSNCPKLDSIINFALAQRGKNYKYATYGPNTFDCSGLMYHTFNAFNINIGRSSRDQYKNGTKVAKNDVKPGDLVFFYRGKKSKKYIGHVGMVVAVDSNNNFTFVHSSSPKYGVRLDQSTKSGYASTYVGARRIIDCENSSFDQNSFLNAPNSIAQPQSNTPPHNTSNATNSNSNKYHVVKQGDTLSAISRKHNVSVQNIQKWNNLKSDKIYPGQKLIVKKL
jgi:cell wall-associated NlpC family hydrolase